MCHGDPRICAFLVMVLPFVSPPIVAAPPDGNRSITTFTSNDWQALREFHFPALPMIDEVHAPSPTATAMANSTLAFISNPDVYGVFMRVDNALQAYRDTPSGATGDQGPWLGAPKVPAGCIAPSAAALSASPIAKKCGECFERAQAELDTVRRRFHRVQLIYRGGIAHMKALIAFGESARMSSPFAYAATREQAKSLAADADRVRASYDRAYDALLKQLKTALDHVGECEDKAFHDDWYDRYGFVLYESFAMHYQRAD